MFVDENDWMVVEAYMSDIHPEIRPEILNAVRQSEDQIVALSERIATDMMVFAFAWHLALVDAIDQARKPRKNTGGAS